MGGAFITAFFTSLAVSMVMNMLFRPKKQSPTYDGAMMTQTNNTLPIPLAYGTVKAAGNMIWQRISDDKKKTWRLVCFCDGPVKAITDVRLNDMGIEDHEITYFYIWNNIWPSATVTVMGGMNMPNGGSFLLDGFGNLLPSHIYLYHEEEIPDAYGGTTIVPFHNDISFSKSNMEKAISDIIALGNGWQVSVAQTDISPQYLISSEEVNCYSHPRPINVRISDKNYIKASKAHVRTYLGDGNQLIDDMVTSNTGGTLTQAERAQKVGGLKWDAYAAIYAKATDTLNGDFNTTAMITGRIVKIFTSPTDFYFQWSDNPAWCILDFLTCYNGVGLTMEQLDIQSFIDAAAYCDELVTSIEGGLTRRFTLNLILDEKKSRLDWLVEMMLSCRAFPTYQNGKYGMCIERAVENPVQSFNSNNMNELEVWWSPLEEIVDILRIQYVDPYYSYAKICAQAEADEYLRPKQPFVHDVEILGCNNFSQASRLAWFYLNQSISTPMYIKFKTDKRSISRCIGDVISVSDFVLDIQNKWFIILQIEDTQEDKVLITCREYNGDLYNDQHASVKPVADVTKLPNPFEFVEEVSNVVLSEFYSIQKDGKIINNISVTYDLPAYQWTRSVELYYSLDNNVWIPGDKGLSGKFVISDVQTPATTNDPPITYYVKLLMTNTIGLQSDGIVTTIDVTGKMIPPADVTNFVATQDVNDATNIILTWDLISDADNEFYEIRVGDSWDAGTVVSNNIAKTVPTWYNKVTVDGTYNYFIKAKDSSGNYSLNATTTSIIVTVEPDDITGFTATQDI